MQRASPTVINGALLILRRGVRKWTGPMRSLNPFFGPNTGRRLYGGKRSDRRYVAMTSEDRQIIEVVLSNQVSIMRGIALILESGTVGTYNAAGELRKQADVVEDIMKEMSKS
jgi:hypothetical protein